MFAELSNVKTDRNLLAGLFVEVAEVPEPRTWAKERGQSGARRKCAVGRQLIACLR